MNKDIKNIIIITLIWILVILIVNPFGEFTREDDFAYARPVNTLLESGTMQLTDWSSMTLVGHIWLGWLTTSIFGFSHTVLRLTELFFGLLGIIGIYFLAKEFFDDLLKQIAAVILFGFSPQFFFYNFVFMTDITFFAFFVWSLLFFIRYLKNEKAGSYIIALILGLYAFLIRDLALVLPLAFVFAAAGKYGLKSKRLYLVSLPLLLFVLEYFLYRYWLEQVHGLTANMDFSRNRLMQMLTDPEFLIKNLIKNFVYSGLYLGFYLSPVAVPVFFNFLKRESKKIRTFLLVVSFFSAITMMIISFAFPGVQNVMKFVLFIHHYPVWHHIPDVHNPTLEMINIMPVWLLATASAVSVFAAVSILTILASSLFRQIKSRKLFNISPERGPSDMLIWTFVIYYTLILSQIFFPRYQIQSIGLLAVILLMTNKEALFRNKIIRAFSFTLAVFIIFSSISGTRDMMEFGRTRQTALDYLEKELNIPPEKIDGGFEFNSWHLFDWYYKEKDKNRWWVKDDEYVVVWGKIKNYELLKEYEFTRFFPPGTRNKIYVYKRIEK